MKIENEDNAHLTYSFSDYASFNKIFDLYYPRLCAYVFQITNNSNASEDIVQEVFIRLWNGRERIVIHEHLLGYLLKASRNAALNYLRSEASRKKTMESLPVDIEINESNLLEEQEFIDLVTECIEELPERSKQVFLMSRFEGLKQKEIADKLGVSIKTIKNQIWKSLQYLKSCLEIKEAL
ncbi:RNA polymerase sigma factor [Sunxiuqinia indica]|uniref:RNA polymerase sigma factor n=1 Tax=Sunxiuqinia indica TaxID=2692584 RepID=UPI00135C6F57|nr:RNA polymerase sigma-70 factor [Sunxiuqinia indica]